MGDMISRTAAIDALGECPYNWNDWPEEIQAVNDWQDAIESIKNVPAVDAAQMVQGEWVEEPDRRGHYHCSNCGVVWGVSAKAMKYCPNCAAKMMNSPMWEVDGERRDNDAAD